MPNLFFGRVPYYEVVVYCYLLVLVLVLVFDHRSHTEWPVVNTHAFLLNYFHPLLLLLLLFLFRLCWLIKSIIENKSTCPQNASTVSDMPKTSTCVLCVC